MDSDRDSVGSRKDRKGNTIVKGGTHKASFADEATGQAIEDVQEVQAVKNGGTGCCNIL